MNASKYNFVSTNEILSDVLMLVQDTDFKLVSKGFYTSQVQQALEELSFDTYFDKRTETFDIPDNFRIEMPKGAFNIEAMYLFNGDECNINNSTPVWWKRNFISSKSGNGYVAGNKGINTDRFNKTTVTNQNGLFYYGVQNGEIMLSSNCKGAYNKLYLVYHGTGGDIGEVPFIPLFLRQAVKDYVAKKVLTIKIAKSEPIDRPMWMNLLSLTIKDLENPYEGSWAKAERRVRKLDMKERRDMKEYMQKMDY